MILNILSLIICCLVVSCGPSSMADFRHQGQEVIEQLIENLKDVETREDLIKLKPKLEKQFQELVAIMIEAKEFQESHGVDRELLDFNEKDLILSERLRKELERIYAMEDGLELIEKSQSQALEALDFYEKQQTRKKQNMK